MNLARFISFWSGFCSLSLEIAWIRYYGYANSSTPRAFAYVLILYLLGIAAGAYIGRRLCGKLTDAELRSAAALILSIAGVAAVVAPWTLIYSRAWALDELLTPLGIFVTASTLSILFPITHHLGTPKKDVASSARKGRHFSRVYMLNVAGASLGPLVTGYILLEYLTVTQIFSVLGMVISVVALGVWTWSCTWHRFVVAATVAASLVTTSLAALYGWRHAGLFAEQLAVVGERTVTAMHESRHGIIVIASDRTSPSSSFMDDVVYGGNVYDGKVNVDLERNTNGLERPLALHVLNPSAKKVLILGLSIGSWLTVVEGFPGVEEIDVVEINPGYLDLAKGFGPQSRALRDPRVRLHIDDARRWLRYQPDKRYDLILMNTTWHWRANSSLLLSHEMMQLINRHLTSKGVVAFNATGSVDVFYTAAHVFKETRRYVNFVYGANWDAFTPASDPQSWAVLKHVTIDGKPGFKDDSIKWKEFSAQPFFKLKHDLDKLGRPAELITDDNMLVEYRYGRKN